MSKFWIIAILVGCAILKTSAADNDKYVLVGTWEEETGNRHAFVFRASLLDLVRKAESPIVNRAFVAKTSQKRCCKPIKLSEHVWKCCDGTYLVTTNANYLALLESKVEDDRWTDEVWEKKLGQLESWRSIAAALRENPPIEIEPSDSRFDLLPWKEIPNYRERLLPR
jgi:hypothetical protein